MVILWATYQTPRSKGKPRRVAFEIIPTPQFYQHSYCSVGWRCDEIKVCIHNFLYYRRTAGYKKPVRGVQQPRGFRSKIYCDIDVTLPQAKACLQKYLQSVCDALPETIKIEVE